MGETKHAREKPHSYRKRTPLAIFVNDRNELAPPTTEIFERPPEIVVKVRVGEDTLVLVDTHLRHVSTRALKHGIDKLAQPDPGGIAPHVDEGVATDATRGVRRLGPRGLQRNRGLVLQMDCAQSRYRCRGLGRRCTRGGRLT